MFLVSCEHNDDGGTHNPDVEAARVRLPHACRIAMCTPAGGRNSGGRAPGVRPCGGCGRSVSDSPGQSGQPASRPRETARGRRLAWHSSSVRSSRCEARTVREGGRRLAAALTPCRQDAPRAIAPRRNLLTIAASFRGTTRLARALHARLPPVSAHIRNQQEIADHECKKRNEAWYGTSPRGRRRN